jgi:signal transduction histidine kinase
MQQSYAKLCGVTETVAVADLVEDSLRLNAGAFVRHGVTLRREFSEVPPITVDKHKVLQILVNLVRNAKYACDESGRIRQADSRCASNRAPAGVRICVIDNGVGIRPENMTGCSRTASPPAQSDTASVCTAARSRRRNSADRCA